MAEKDLFFNALPDASSETGYDRNYTADDLSDWLSMICETGVIKSTTGLKVVETTGLKVNVNAGKASILGKGYFNTSVKSLNIATAPTGSQTRYDLIVVRFNNNSSVRKIESVVKTGSLSSSVPTNTQLLAQLTRTTLVYEILLAVVAVAPNATTIPQTAITDKRGNTTLCPWFTAVKGYDDYYDAIVQSFEYNETASSSKRTFTTNIASRLYNSSYSQVSVYTNGLREATNGYAISATGSYLVITFTTSRSSGSKISVVLDNYIDGEGMTTALASYNEWVEDVENLKTANEYDYVCNGVNDNILISNLAQSFVNDSTIPDDAQLKINVHGTCGIASAYGGDGTSSSRYRWFSIGTGTTTAKRITVDFSSCEKVNIPLTANTYNTIFFGANVHVVGIKLIANCTGTECNVYIFGATNGEVIAENSYFESVSTDIVLLSRTGTFLNCESYLSSANNHAYCFLFDSGSKPIIVVGGKYRAYTATSDASIISAVVYSPTGETNAVCVLTGVNCPTIARTNFYQKNCLRVNSGYITSNGLITALTNSTASGATASITGTIPISKA